MKKYCNNPNEKGICRIDPYKVQYHMHMKVCFYRELHVRSHFVYNWVK